MGDLTDLVDRAAKATEIRVGEAVPSGEEKLLAAATYLLGFVGAWLVGAILIYFWQRDRSRYVAFHAVQSVILQAFIAIAVVVVLATTFAGFLGTAIMSQGSGGPESALIPTAILVAGYAFCLIAPIYWTLRGAWVAAHGRLYEAPLVGRLARKLVHDVTPQP